ncbi:MAG: ATP-binding protein [Bacteroidota bacterium]
MVQEKLNQVLETEQRLSRRIHDELANDIFGVSFKIQNSTIDEKEKNELLDSLDSIYRRARDISRDVSVPISTEGVFLDAIRELLRSIEERKSIKITPVFRGLDNNFEISKSKQIQIYRIIQELVINAVKHSKAKQIFVQFFNRDNQLEVFVEDDGIGFDKNKTTFGAGLNNVKSRVNYLKGKITIDSAHKKGTLIDIKIPI